MRDISLVLMSGDISIEHCCCAIVGLKLRMQLGSEVQDFNPEMEYE